MILFVWIKGNWEKRKGVMYFPSIEKQIIGKEMYERKLDWKGTSHFSRKNFSNNEKVGRKIHFFFIPFPFSSLPCLSSKKKTYPNILKVGLVFVWFPFHIELFNLTLIIIEWILLRLLSYTYRNKLEKIHW